jgi:hypothetical protein
LTETKKDEYNVHHHFPRTNPRRRGARRQSPARDRLCYEPRWYVTLEEEKQHSYELFFLHHQKRRPRLNEPYPSSIYTHTQSQLTYPPSPPTASFQYSHAVGKTSVDDKTAKDIQEDAVFLLASQTKLLTAFSAMLVVERGLIGLDDDVSELLPELGGQKVLRGFEDDGNGGERAVLEEREGKLTLRYVLLKVLSDKWNETIV